MDRTLKSLSLILSYPSAELQETMPAIADVFAADPRLPLATRAALEALAYQLSHSDLYDLQERYVMLFDRSRTLSLNLFEHVHGESRERGGAMVSLIETYRDGGFEPAIAVGLDQTDHRAAALAAFAVDVFKKVERQCPRPVEQHHIPLLQVIEVGMGQLIGEGLERSAGGKRQPRIGCEDVGDGGHRFLQFGRGIAQDQRQGFEGAVHQNDSSGRAKDFFLPPNRLVLPLSPSEQPLPSVKPQPPRMSAPASFCSRCAVGIAKRSS